MPLTPGSSLGPYEIVSPLGAGGMGEVHRARDSRLGRDVAIKALPDAFARDPDRLARFEREAKLLASLSHANIAGIHGLEEHDGQRYLILEFVDGMTLSDRLRRGALPMDEAIDVASQVALALEAAHDAGIIHRDLKPGNIMLTGSGQVKVLDFGLAKSAGPGGSSPDANLSASPTMTYAATEAGTILGTAAYMSPEQARGRAVDRRTDIWSYGCVLYECLAGRPLHTGETVSDLVAQILKSEPDWSALPDTTPSAVRRVLERCLRKDARDRLRDIGDARLELKEREPDAIAPASKPAGAGVVGLVSAVVLASAITGLAVSSLQRPAPTSATQELSVMLPHGTRLAANGSNHFMALSPSGRAIAFVARSEDGLQVHVRRLDRREEISIPGTQDARDLFFSPDGEWVAYFDTQNLLKVSVHGGAPIALSPGTQDRGGVWLDDGTIVFSPDATQPLARLPKGGGPAQSLTQLDSTRQERTHRWPDALDGGPWVVFTVGLKSSPGDYDGSDIDAVSVRTGERRNLLRGARRAMWAAPGHLVFDRKGTLFAVRIDPRNPKVVDEPVPVVEAVGGEASSGASFMSLARDGTLAWVPSDAFGIEREVGWFDRSGAWSPTPIRPGDYRDLAISPDGSSALVGVGPGGGALDIWLADLASGGMRRLTYSGRTNNVAWLPDGSGFIHAHADSLGHGFLEERRLHSGRGARTLLEVSQSTTLGDVSRDGSRVLFADWGSASGRMYFATLGENPRSEQIATDAGPNMYELAANFSPDGRWLVYISNRTGREEVFVRSLDGTRGPWQVSTQGGGGARWGRGGSELFFVERELLKSVMVREQSGDLVFSQPVALFEPPGSPTDITFRDYSYDHRHDRFLFTRPPTGTEERREVAVSVGWGARIDEMIRARKSR